MINFDEFDIEENSTDIYGFLSSDGLRIIKTCGKKNADLILDTFKKLHITWASGYLPLKREIMEYRYFIVYDNNVTYYADYDEYMKRKHSSRKYYDACDKSVKTF